MPRVRRPFVECIILMIKTFLTRGRPRPGLLDAYLVGIEPTTFGSANQCSIQLSYRYIYENSTILKAFLESNPHTTLLICNKILHIPTFQFLKCFTMRMTKLILFPTHTNRYLRFCET